MEHKSFETDRLLIRPVQESDAGFIYELMNSDAWIKNIGDRNIHTEEDALSYIKTKMFPQMERLGYGNYTIVLKESNSCIGTCGLYDRAGLKGIDIGFALLPSYMRKGYGYEAARRILEAAFTDFDIKEIQGITLEENLASRKLLEKLGLSLSGTTRIPNDEEELLLYQINNPHDYH